ncbi:hypothetical protein BDN70DRAFT_445482 [Pholiota conissans]|uniref:Uncharacterized protein n=1 Tax=Pholiota conissans TaxID=109636 RepID=A0A9P5Z7C6_9AGAR|nr:hypothetical protein BDN70DRAFT_445482 [Pholiota conissans]
MHPRRTLKHRTWRSGKSFKPRGRRTIPSSPTIASGGSSTAQFWSLPRIESQAWWRNVRDEERVCGAHLTRFLCETSRQRVCVRFFQTLTRDINGIEKRAQGMVVIDSGYFLTLLLRLLQTSNRWFSTIMAISNVKIALAGHLLQPFASQPFLGTLYERDATQRRPNTSDIHRVLVLI